MGEIPTHSTTGRALCDLCSDPIEADEHRDKLDGRMVHTDCAAQHRRPLRVVS